MVTVTGCVFGKEKKLPQASTLNPKLKTSKRKLERLVFAGFADRSKPAATGHNSDITLTLNLLIFQQSMLMFTGTFYTHGGLMSCTSQSSPSQPKPKRRVSRLLLPGRSDRGVSEACSRVSAS